jgi:hypothetical protein
MKKFLKLPAPVQLFAVVALMVTLDAAMQVVAMILPVEHTLFFLCLVVSVNAAGIIAGWAIIRAHVTTQYKWRK